METKSKILEEEYDENYEPSKDEIVEYCEFLGMDVEKEQHLFWIARESLKAPLPPEWKPCQTADGSIYYFNFKTGASIWDHPCDDFYREMYAQAKKMNREELEAFKAEVEKTSLQRKQAKPEPETFTSKGLGDIHNNNTKESKSETKSLLPISSAKIGPKSIPPITKELKPLKNVLPSPAIFHTEKNIVTKKMESDSESFEVKRDYSVTKAAVPVASQKNDFDDDLDDFDVSLSSDSENAIKKVPLPGNFTTQSSNLLNTTTTTAKNSTSKETIVKKKSSNENVYYFDDKNKIPDVLHKSVESITSTKKTMDNGTVLNETCTTQKKQETIDSSRKQDAIDSFDDDSSKNDSEKSKNSDFPLLLKNESVLKPLKTEISSKVQASVPTLVTEEEMKKKLETQQEELLSVHNRKLAAYQEQQEKIYETKIHNINDQFKTNLEKFHSEVELVLKSERDAISNKLLVEIFDHGPVIKRPSKPTTDINSINNFIEKYRIRFETMLMQCWKGIHEEYSRKIEQTKSTIEEKNSQELENYKISIMREDNVRYKLESEKVMEQHKKRLDELAQKLDLEAKEQEFQLIERFKSIQLQLEKQNFEAESKLRNLEIDSSNRYLEKQKEWDLRFAKLEKSHAEHEKNIQDIQAKHPLPNLQPSSSEVIKLEEKTSELRTLENELNQKAESLVLKEVELKRLAQVLQEKQSEIENERRLLNTQFLLSKREQEAAVEKEQVYDTTKKQEYSNKNDEILNKRSKSVPKQKKAWDHEKEEELSDLQFSSDSDRSIDDNSALQELKQKLKQEEKNLRKAKRYLAAQKKEIYSELDELHFSAIQNEDSDTEIRTRQPIVKRNAKEKQGSKIDISKKNYNTTVSEIEEESEIEIRTRKRRNPIDLHQEKSPFDLIEKDLDTLLGALQKKPVKVSLDMNTPIPRSTIVSDNLELPTKQYPKVYLTRPRHDEWINSQKRSEALLQEHHEWLSKFEIKQRGLL